MIIMKRRIILLAIIMVSFSSSVRAGGMANVPLDHWSYDAVNRLVAQGIIKDISIYTRPYTRYEMAKFIAQALAFRQIGKVTLSSHNNKLLDKLSSEFSEELAFLGIEVPEKKEKKSFIDWAWEKGSVKVNGYLEKKFSDKEELPVTLGFSTFVDEGDKLSVFGRFHIDYQRKYERFTENCTWVLDNVYTQIKLPWFDLEFGRDKIRWGPGYHGALIVSDNAPSFDMVKFSTTLGPVKVVSFAAVLDKSNERYFSGHRLETDLISGVNLGFSETVVYSGRGIEPLYFNLLLPVYLCKHLLGTDDNTAMAFDISIHRWDNIELYGELLVDHFRIYRTSPGVDELGFLGGVFFCFPSGRSDLRLEYTRITNYVYTRGVEENIYIHQNSIIGHWLGPDAEDLFFELNHRINNKACLTFQYEIENHGEGEIWDVWTPEEAEEGEEYSLSGIVERKNIITLKASYEPSSRWKLALEVNFWNTQNKDHIEGVSSEDKEIKAEIKWKF